MHRVGTDRRWFGLAGGGLMLLAAQTGVLVSAGPSWGTPLLPPRATVVLLPGLPGDLEHERRYSEQLQDWTQFLAGQAETAEKIHVFWSADPPPLPPSPIPVESWLANREQFLTLGQNLAGHTNPIVAIVWGHGGRRGSTPVFHVRGPRLTPEDFSAFARHAPQAQWRWILIFRGSGQFAAQLAATNALILSSDHQSDPNNDPVGMRLLLDLLKARPDHSFESLAAEWGGSTAAWFDERKLARTEEPTLWLPGRPPQALVQGDTAVAGLAGASPGSVPAPPPPPPAEGSTASPSNQPAWADLPPALASDYPDQDAVVLQQRLRCTLGDAPSLAMEREVVLQILTLEGKRYGDFTFAYDPPDEELRLLDCEVLRPDGTLVRLGQEDIRETSDQGMGEYRGGREKFFSLPGITPGAILHVRYQTEWKSYPLPYVSLTLPLSPDLPVREAWLELSLPKTATFHFAFQHVDADDPEVSQGAYGTTYQWRLANLPGNQPEELAPRETDPSLFISTFPDWAALTQWYERVTRLADNLTPEISACAKELTEAAPSDRDKVRLLYNYVTGLRYVPVPLGVNSFRPHAAAHVFRNQYGDCKDKANLFNTLLQAIGIQAHLVLVPRFATARQNLPGFVFNHAISRVTVDGETLWIDTTDDVCRFGLLPPGDPGRNVLVIDGQSHTLTSLPQPKPGDHQLILQCEIDCRHPASPPSAKLALRASGYCDYQLRMADRARKEAAPHQPLLASLFSPTAGLFALARQHSSALADLENEFAWNSEGTWAGILVSRADKRLIQAPFWLPADWAMALHARRSPLFLNEGYPLLLQETITFLLPTSPGTIALPPAADQADGPLRWKVQWADSAPHILRAQLQVELERGELSPTETTRFQDQYRRLFDALSRPPAF